MQPRRVSALLEVRREAAQPWGCPVRGAAVASEAAGLTGAGGRRTAAAGGTGCSDWVS